ncbi:MAG: phosphate signaling complex protein PhoU [Bacteroidales bacterium]
MTSIDSNILQIKADLIQMWSLVISQMEKARIALINGDHDLAREVVMNEKRVDAFELKIDMDSESTLMLKNPVAIDLRFILSVLKINYNIERVGDYANAIAKVAGNSKDPIPENILQATHLPEMFFTAQAMLQQSLDAFENADRSRVNQLFGMDEKLDKTNKKANLIIGGLIQENPENTMLLLDALSIIRKLERTGDHILNVAEELIYYFDANIIKHRKLHNTDLSNPENL